MEIIKSIINKFSTDLLLSDIIQITFSRIKSNRFRSFLTILGMGIGIGAVYFLVSLTFGLQQLVIGKIATSDSLLSLDVVPNTEMTQLIKLDSKSVAQIKQIADVKEISTVKSSAAEVSFNDLKGQSLLYGVDPSYFRLAGLNTTKGDFFGDGQKDKAIISSAILSLFNLKEDTAVGTKIRISLLTINNPLASTTATDSAQTVGGESIDTIEIPYQFTISGIINDDSSYIYVSQDNFDVINLDEYKQAKVKVASTDKVNSVRDEVVAMGFMATALTDTLAQVNQIFSITQITFTVVGIVALFVAAIGMLNTMTVSLLERTREIGIMKALGATEGGIRQMFLAESIIMGFGGGLAGLLAGFIFTKIIGLLVNLLALSLGGQTVNIFYTPLWFIGLVLIFSLIIGLVTGLIPARRAAKLDPLDALRYE